MIRTFHVSYTTSPIGSGVFHEQTGRVRRQQFDIFVGRAWLPLPDPTLPARSEPSRVSSLSLQTRAGQRVRHAKLMKCPSVLRPAFQVTTNH